MEYYLNGEKLKGIKLPDCLGGNSILKDKFRFAAGELSLLAGINGAGKSLLASQLMNSAVDQGYRCLSISLEMSPRQQLARILRQCSLMATPSMDAALDFAKWSGESLWFYDQYGSVNPRTLFSIIRYAIDVHAVDFVLVDSLMTLSTASDDWNGQKDVICGLAGAARGLDTHVMLVAHARKGASVKDRLDRWSVAGSADLTNRADNVFLLGRTFETDPHQPDAYLSLCKARNFDGAEMDIDLWLDMASMNYYRDSELPTQMGMGDSVKPEGGVVGELEVAGLN
jgi:twinkle protein